MRELRMSVIRGVDSDEWKCDVSEHDDGSALRT